MGACMYAPGSWGDCLDLTCGAQGGRCRYEENEWGRWRCRCEAQLPSPNRLLQKVTAMDSPLDRYRRIVAEQPPCDARLLQESLERYRTGDPSAARALSGSCLRLALQLAEEHTRELPSQPLLEVVEEANAGLMDAITSYAGRDLDEFLRHAEDGIRRRLAVLA